MALILFDFCAVVLFSSLVFGRVREQGPQHVLNGEAAAGNPLPQAAEIVRERLQRAEIIPTVIDDFLPSLGVHVVWPSHSRALLGNTISPERLQDEPSIALHDMQAAAAKFDPSGHAGNTSYVITMTDPDAPSRDKPKWSEFCHWIASGTLKPGLCDPKHPLPCPPVLTDLDVVMPYKPPAPPAKTGRHRYVFLAFVPSNGTTDKLHLSKPPGRKHWGYKTDKDKSKGVRKWADENGLSPVGANFIYAKNQKQ